jgi:sialidase-1
MLAMLPQVATAADELPQVDVFTAGSEGYHTYRIPALVVTPKGTLLAICEGRKTGRGDHGDLDLIQKRSTDGGRTWGKLELIHEEGGEAKITIGNPCPVVDQETGVIWLPFNRDND